MTEIPVPPEAVTAALDDLTAWAVSYDWLTGLRPDQVRSVCSGMVGRVLEIAAPAIRASERSRLDIAWAGQFPDDEVPAEWIEAAARAIHRGEWPDCGCGIPEAHEGVMAADTDMASEAVYEVGPLIAAAERQRIAAGVLALIPQAASRADFLEWLAEAIRSNALAGEETP